MTRKEKDTQILLKKIYSFSLKEKTKLYLVGGFLRDFLLKINSSLNYYVRDIDFCLKKNAIKFGRKLAKILKAGFVVLDKEHGCCRLVKRIKDKTYTLDFTHFRGKDLKEDLLHRDFTINAFAIELKDFLNKKDIQGFIFDPFLGIKDLKEKILRIVNEDGFREDPLRILRAFSISLELNFKIDKKTILLIKRDRKMLSSVAGERVRDELFKILASPFSYNCLKMMDDLKVLEVIFPSIKNMRNVYQGPYHHLDVFEHSLETVRQLEILFKEFSKDKDLDLYLDEVISAERSRRSLLKLAGFFHDIGKPKAKRWQNGKVKFHGHERIGLNFVEEISQSLKLSNSEKEILKTIVLWHLRPGYLADLETISPRAKFRFFRDTAKEAVSVLLVSLADQRATCGPLTTKESRMKHERVVKSLIKEYFKKQKEKPIPRLINGNDLIKIFKLTPSPLFGKILKQIEELQAIGKIKTRKEALRWVEKFLKHYQLKNG
jgi:poly(A) polymerase